MIWNTVLASSLFVGDRNNNTGHWGQTHVVIKHSMIIRLWMVHLTIHTTLLSILIYHIIIATCFEQIGSSSDKQNYQLNF